MSRLVLSDAARGARAECGAYLVRGVLVRVVQAEAPRLPGSALEGSAESGGGSPSERRHCGRFEEQTTAVVGRRAGGRGVQLFERVVVVNEVAAPSLCRGRGSPTRSNHGAQAGSGTSGDPSGQELE